MSQTGGPWSSRYISTPVVWLQLSNEKNHPTFHYTGWLIGILIMVYYNPLYNWVGFHPLYNPTNQGPFFHCSTHGSSFFFGFEGPELDWPHALVLALVGAGGPENLGVSLLVDSLVGNCMTWWWQLKHFCYFYPENWGKDPI